MKSKAIIKLLENPIFKSLYILATYVCAIIPDGIYLRILYRVRMGEKLNLNNPVTFNEKMQWLKIYQKKNDHSYMTDKARVRDYIEKKIGKEYLIDTVGIYDSYEDIKFEDLPDEFVVKCTHDSGSVILCNSKEDLIRNKNKLKKALKRKYYLAGREYSYKGITPRLIIEKKLTNDPDKGLRDYKFYCFNGEPTYLYISEGLLKHSTARISFYNIDYSLADFCRSDYPRLDYLPEKPVNYEKMLDICKILSEGNPFVRVDLYEVDGKIYFSELTFSPCGGYMPFEPKEYDRILGEKLILPRKKGKK